MSPDNPYKARLDEIQKRNRKKIPLASYKHTPHTPWPIEKKVEVVAKWLIFGNLRQVAALTGVPYGLVREWKGQAWWAEMVAEIRTTEGLEMDGKLSNLINKSLDAVLDRVENGDFIYDQKSGEVRRKPAALRDLHRVAVDSLAKREVLREKSEENKQIATVTVAEHLKLLATEMSKWNKPKQHAIVNEEVEDAVPKEWEEGLQTGTSMGTYEEAGESEGASSPELGTADDGGSREGS